MKKFITHIIFIFLTFVTYSSFAQEHEFLIQGDKAYKNEDLSKAEEEYLRAIEANPESFKGLYNHANIIEQSAESEENVEMKEKRIEQAKDSYLKAIANAKNDKHKSYAYNNLGNIYMNKQEYKKGIDAYKNSLRLNPDDVETKMNLQYALKQMQQQQQQQQQSQSQNQKQEEGDNQEQQDEKNQPSEGKRSDKEQKDNKENNKSSESKENEDEPKDSDSNPSDEESQTAEQDENKNEPSPESLSKEEVLRQLKVMDDIEKKVKEKLKKEQKSDYKSDKDW